MTVWYDPPAGWQYGFPKAYKPIKGETLEQTLLRDGYPQHELDWGAAKHCRFIGDKKEVEGILHDARPTDGTREGSS